MVYHHVTLIPYTFYLVTMSCLLSESTRLTAGQFRQAPTLTIRDPVPPDYIHEAQGMFFQHVNIWLQ